jgi:hypothetical protein
LSDQVAISCCSERGRCCPFVDLVALILYTFEVDAVGFEVSCETAVVACPSAKNISVWADWLRQSGRAPSEPSETPRWRITPRPASIPRVDLHIAFRSPFRHFFSLCRSLILNEHSGVVSNCDHTSEWVHCVHANIGIAMHEDPCNCADPRNLAQSQ